MSPRPAPASILGDAIRYVATWRTTGAVAPSGPVLSRRMVRDVDPSSPLPVLELGPGNGVVTKALLDRGVPAERIVAVEYNPEFCRMLTSRYPKLRVVEGDAFNLAQTLRGIHDGKFSAVVSSLPLLLFPAPARHALVLEALSRLAPGGAMFQFSYSPKPPVPPSPGEYKLSGSPYILRNIPPARVWTYRPL